MRTETATPAPVPPWAYPAPEPTLRGFNPADLAAFFDGRVPEPIAFYRTAEGDFAAFEEPPCVVHWPDCQADAFHVYRPPEDEDPMTQETYIKEVTSNIRGGLSFSLARLALFYGDSRTGKTMRVRAVQIAADGGASDMQGRSWVKDGRLQRLAPEGEDLHIEAKLVQGDTEHDITFGKEDHSRPKGVVMAFEHVKEALCGAPERALEFLSPWMDVSEEELVKLFPSSLREVYKEIASTLPGTLSPLQKLHHVTDLADKQMREANKQAKARQLALDSLRAQEKPSPEAIEQAREAVEKAKERTSVIEEQRNAALQDRGREEVAQTLKRATAEYRDLSETMKRVKASLETAMLRSQKAAQALEDARIARGKLTEVQEQGNAKRAAVWQQIHTFASQHLEAGAKKCALCGTEHDPDTFRTHLEARVQQAETQLAQFAILSEAKDIEHNVALAQSEAHNAREEVERLQARVDELRTKIDAVTEEGKAARAKLDAMPEVPEPVGDLRADMQAALADLQAATAHLTQLESARESGEDTQRLRDDLDQNQTKADTMKRLKAAAKKAAKEAADLCTDGVEKRVTQFLPKGMTFGFSSDPVRWGLRAPDGSINEFLSGAETVVVLSALAFAFAAANPDAFVLVVPEERFIDAKLLGRTMRHWGKVAPENAQVLITNGVKPRGRAPAGWLIEEITGEDVDEEEDDA